MSTKKLIGRIPISKGEYVAGQKYNRLSQVFLYGSTYQSKVDDNTTVPAIIDSDGNVQHSNTDKWLVVADGSSAYNAGERTSMLSVRDEEVYLNAEVDLEEKVLSCTFSDGSHYSRNIKSESIDRLSSAIDQKVDKEDGKCLVDSDVASTQFVFEDLEERMEIKTDLEEKIISYRDKYGIPHEKDIVLEHIHLSDEAAKEVNDSFKSAGIKIDNPSDFSQESHIEVPIPRVAAKVVIISPRLPATKKDNIKAEIEYNDKDGNYFRKPIILNAQGSSSMSYYVKNLSIDIDDGSNIRFGDFPTQDSFHLKKYYIDVFRGQCIVAYHLMEQIYKSREIGKQYPYENMISNDSVSSGIGSAKEDFFTGAKCHPDGFPIIVTHRNSDTGEETEMGIYTWNLKKSKEVYFCDKKNTKNIILDGMIEYQDFWNDNVNWYAFEVRNPKSLVDKNGNPYDGDSPMELSDTDPKSKEVKDRIIRFSKVSKALEASNTRETFEKYFLVNPFIDYYLASEAIYHIDGFAKNWIWCTWDGEHWCPNLYDCDSIFGSQVQGTHFYKDSEKRDIQYIITFGLESLYESEVKTRYKELRDKGIFTAENITELLYDWLKAIGYDNIKKEIELYPETPSYRDSMESDKWDMVFDFDAAEEYSDVKTYHVGDKCKYQGYVFQAKEECSGTAPLTGSYHNLPQYGGCFNSPKRVYNWLVARFAYLDNKFNYNKGE